MFDKRLIVALTWATVRSPDLGHWDVLSLQQNVLIEESLPIYSDGNSTIASQRAIKGLSESCIRGKAKLSARRTTQQTRSIPPIVLGLLERLSCVIRASQH